MGRDLVLKVKYSLGFRAKGFRRQEQDLVFVSTQKHRVDPLRSFACETLALKALSASVQDSHLPWENNENFALS